MEFNFLAQQKLLQAYDTHADAIFRYCYDRTGDASKAQDFVQEIFFKAWKQMTSLQPHNYIEEDDIKILLYNMADITINKLDKKPLLSFLAFFSDRRY